MAVVSSAEIAQEVERFIRARFQVSPDDSTFGADSDLWDEGYLDSLGITEVIAFLECRFTVHIPTYILFDPAFVRINGMARLTFELMSVPAEVA